MTTSPNSATRSRMKSLAGSIFRRSVHQRKRRDGAGYPRPIMFTQKLLSTSGVTLKVWIGMPVASAACCIWASEVSMYRDTTGVSTSVSEVIT